MFPSTFLLKNTTFFISKKSKTRTFQLLVITIFHAKEKINSSFFCFLCRVETSSSSFLRLCKFHKYYGKIIFLPTSYVGKNCFCSQTSITPTFVYPKFINPSFLLNMNFPFVQSSCFCNNFFLTQKLVSYNHFKRPKTILIRRQSVKRN